MDTEAVLAGLRDQLAGGSIRALPAALYLDRGVFERERERIFRPGWHAVARANELKDVGDYRALELFGEPVLLVRDPERRLRAFSRVCLHRASPIVEGEGNAKSFTCPYHRWGYDLEGRLRAAPFMEDVPGFDREACRLPELSLCEWQGFVLVSPDPAASPPEARLAKLAEQLAPWRFEELEIIETLEYESAWNWKVMVENYIESYHHMGPHAGSLQPLNPARGTHAVDLDGDFILLENPASEGATPFWVMHVFPTLLFTLSRDDSALATWYEMRIAGPDRFLLRIHVMLRPAAAADPASVEFASNAVRAVHAEDIPMCEGIQRGLQSRLWRPGTLSLQESTLHRFHRQLAERLCA